MKTSYFLFGCVLTAAMVMMASGSDEGSVDASPQNPPAEVASLKTEAEQGDAEAQFRLYEYLQGEQKTHEALSWLLRAASSGHARARLVLGACCLAADAPFEKDTGTAVDWIACSALSGDKDAQTLFAELDREFSLHEGEGTREYDDCEMSPRLKSALAALSRASQAHPQKERQREEILVVDAEAAQQLVREFVESQSTAGADSGYALLHYPVQYHKVGLRDREFVMKDRANYTRNFPLRHFECMQVSTSQERAENGILVTTRSKAVVRSAKGEWSGYIVEGCYAVRNIAGRGLRICSISESVQQRFAPSEGEKAQLAGEPDSTAPSPVPLDLTPEVKQAISTLVCEFIESQSSGGGDAGYQKLHYPVLYHKVGLKDRDYVMKDRANYTRNFPLRRFDCEYISVGAGQVAGEFVVTVSYEGIVQSNKGVWNGYRLRGHYIVRNLSGEGLRICSISENVLERFQPEF